MFLEKGQLYHFYNQGNNKQQIFFKRENYLYFLKKFRHHVFPFCKVLSYCLMPNHFHFLILATEKSIIEKKVGSLAIPLLNNGFRLLLSSYCQAINKSQNRTGSLFRQKTKAKLLLNSNINYPLVCFNYIHQNPLNAGLVKKLEEWDFSSFKDYLGIRNGTLCDKNLAFELLDLSNDTFIEVSHDVITKEKIGELL